MVIELYLSWSKECIISEISRTPEIRENNWVDATETTASKFQIDHVKFYLPVVTLSINDNIKFVKNKKQRFKRKRFWNIHRSEITTQTKNNLDYLIDPAFGNNNRLFVFSLKNGDDDPTKNSFEKYYILLVEIKDIDPLIDNKPFFENQFFKNQTGIVWKTYQNVKKQWLYNRKFIRLFVSSKIL